MKTASIALFLLTACASTKSVSVTKPAEASPSVRQAPTIRVIQLRYASAQDTAFILEQFFPMPSSCEGVPEPGVRIVPDVRSNSLILGVDPEKAADEARILELVAQLDVAVGGAR